MGVAYITREEVMASPDIRASAYASREIDRAIESGSRKVEKLCHRKFYQWIGSKSFEYPNAQSARVGRLWLDQHDIISLTSFTAGGVSIPTSAVFLEPSASGPPYSRLEIDRSTIYALAQNSGTSQRSLVPTGVWGYVQTSDIETAGTISSSPSSSTTSLTVAFRAGVGDLLKVDNEWMQVTEKAWLSTGQVGTLTSSNNAQTLAVSDGTAFAVGEELLLDAERVYVRDIAGNNLIVQRAWSGSALAAHTGATIYYPRTLTVSRGVNGSTAAAHSSGATVTRQLFPGPVRELALAYSLDTFFQAGAGYARTVGSGDAERQASGRAIKNLEQDVWGGYARKNRHAAV